MQKSLMAVVVVIGSVVACSDPYRAPNSDGWSSSGWNDGSSTSSTDDNVAPSPDPDRLRQLFFLAYQATGTRNGAPAELTHFIVNSGESTPGLDQIEEGDCVGRRVTPTTTPPPTVLNAAAYNSEDFGPLDITGSTVERQCHHANGAYTCDFDPAARFFGDDDVLSLRVGQGTAQDFSIDAIRPPRAPEPRGDIEKLFKTDMPISVKWTPADAGVEMTCLQIDALDAAGQVIGHVQCDANDSDGVVVVPMSVAAMLGTDAAAMRVALFSVNGAALWRENTYTTAYFGQGRFVEYQRPGQ